MYQTIIARYAAQLLKKLAPRMRLAIFEEFKRIAADPRSAPILTGKLSVLRSWHAYIEGVPYRIIFQIEENAKQVIIQVFGKRDLIYKVVDRLFR